MPDPVQGYRQDGPITSIVFFDAARMAGTWSEVAAFRPPQAPSCQNARATFTPRPDGAMDLIQSTCARLSPVQMKGIAVLTGPGRLTVTLEGQTETWWMLWVDESYRTAVIGMPSGKFGFILNRDPVIPRDRLNAARQILEWNGYDLARLVTPP